MINYMINYIVGAPTFAAKHSCELPWERHSPEWRFWWPLRMAQSTPANREIGAPGNVGAPTFTRKRPVYVT